MKPIAENRFSITKQLFYEGMLSISKDSYGKAAIKYSFVFVAIWVAMAAFLLFTGGTIGQALVYLLLVGVIILWLNVFAPRSHAKKGWNALVNRYGSAMERRTRFYRDHLEIDGDCAAKTVTYQEILEIKESKHLYVLICVDKVGVMVAKDGFAYGDFDEIKSLIREA